MTNPIDPGASNPKRDAEFLKQLPDWEKNYKMSDDLLIHYTPEQWKTAEAVFSEHDLRILGEPVMEDWEEPYMRVLAEIATRNAGTVLEVGYGMGISACFIQELGIDQHIIIEANRDVVRKAQDWARACPVRTVILEGLWQDVITSIPNGSLDGILFDTYPLSERELYQNHFNFFPHAFAKLRSGGVFTYYSDEVESFSEVHKKRLIDAGFCKDLISGRIVAVNPPDDCLYWKAKTILAPIVQK